MITGKDKDRVRLLESKCEQAQHRFETLAEDMKIILEAINDDGIDIISWPYWILANDIGCCEALADILRK